MNYHCAAVQYYNMYYTSTTYLSNGQKPFVTGRYNCLFYIMY